MRGVFFQWKMWAVLCAVSATVALAGEAPVLSYKDGMTVGQWLVVGALPNELIPAAERTGPVDGAGFDRDYLGGEAEAVIDTETVVQYTDAGGTVHTADARLGQGDAINFVSLYTDTERKVAYAFCWIESDSARRVWAQFGSDDRAMVWVNGRRVHRFDARGRGMNLGDDEFTVDLKQGRNRVLVKVENGTQGWGFALKLVSEEMRAELAAKKERRDFVTRVQAVELEPTGQWGVSYLISPGQLPQLRWSNPELIEGYFGELDMKVRWFDRNLNEVEVATTPGRYAAYVEAKSEDGTVIRRALTVYCAPAGFQPQNTRDGVELPYLPNSGLTEETWKQADKWVAEYGDSAYVDQLNDNEIGAEFLGGMYDRQEDRIEVVPGWMNFLVTDQEYHLKLKAKVTGVELKQRLADPRKLEGWPARVLREGTLKEAGFRPGLNAALDELCTRWADETGVPFTFMVTRHGVIAHHGAYGQWQGRTIDTDTPFDIASISKMLTGVMLAQFLDQGLIHLDDPIGEYLVDFPTEGTKVMTVRQGMMHMAGLEGHGNWGGFNNPWFENNITTALEIYEPGRRYIYDGLGLNLVGRVMEMVGGKTYVRLMNENMYQPLGMKHTTVFDTSFGTRTTAHDLACVGLMLLNQGSYGERHFFSPRTLESILPQRTGDLWPDTETPDNIYGMGNHWYHDPYDPDVPEDAPERERSLLGYHTLGHGSATSSVLRVDFDNDMTITMARPTTGPNYGDHFIPILHAIAEHMAEEASATPATSLRQ